MRRSSAGAAMSETVGSFVRIAEAVSARRIEGLEAITAAIGAGISVNVTLIFSLERYREVINAYLTGLEKAKAAGIDLSTIHSVASFFVSRVDTEIDKRLDGDRHRRGARAQEQGRRRERAARLPALRAGVRHRAGARPCSPPAPTASARCGPRPASRTRRCPTRSTSTELVAPGVVNTMPEKTLEATFDHGVIAGDTVTGAYADAGAVLDALAARRRRLRRRDRAARERGRREVHRLVERAARHRPRPRWRRRE